MRLNRLVLLHTLHGSDSAPLRDLEPGGRNSLAVLGEVD